MLDRIEMQVIHMTGVVAFVADRVFPESPLPDAAFPAVHPHPGPVFGLGKALGKTRLDQTPTGREIRIPGRQGPDTVQVVR